MSGIRDALWQASQHLLAPGGESVIRKLVLDWVAGHPGSGRRLDVGCGPKSMLAKAGLDPIGVDLHPGWGTAAASAVHLPFASASFHSVWSFGLFHHLSDLDMEAALREMVRVAEPRGYIIVFDAVLPEEIRPLARLVRWLDRGSYLRRQQQFERLLAPHGDWSVQRITYSLTGLELLLAWTLVSNNQALPH